MTIFGFSREIDTNCAGNKLGKLSRTVEMEKSLPTEGDWEWGGCGDNVKFGFKKSRDFMDAPYRKRSDIKTLVKLHNNNAGRLVRKRFLPFSSVQDSSNLAPTTTSVFCFFLSLLLVRLYTTTDRPSGSL